MGGITVFALSVYINRIYKCRYFRCAINSLGGEASEFCKSPAVTYPTLMFMWNLSSPSTTASCAARSEERRGGREREKIGKVKREGGRDNGVIYIYYSIKYIP